MGDGVRSVFLGDSCSVGVEEDSTLGWSLSCIAARRLGFAPGNSPRTARRFGEIGGVVIAFRFLDSDRRGECADNAISVSLIHAFIMFGRMVQSQ